MASGQSWVRQYFCFTSPRLVRTKPFVRPKLGSRLSRLGDVLSRLSFCAGKFWHMGVCLAHMHVILFAGVGVVRRAVLMAKGSSQWKNFSETDYNFNVRAFRRWMRFDEKVCAQSSSFQALPETNEAFRKRKVKAGDSSATPEPVRKRYKVIELSSDDEWGRRFFVRVRVPVVNFYISFLI